MTGVTTSLAGTASFWTVTGYDPSTSQAMIPVTGYDPSHSSEYRSLDCIVGALLCYQCSTSQGCNFGWKNTKEYWRTVSLGCLHWLSMQWTISMILPGQMQLLWKRIPSCTVAEHLKCGTFARPINRDRVLLPLVYRLSYLFHFLLMLTFVFFFWLNTFL